MTAIKTEEERARLDELYALVEAENAAAEAETEKPETTKPTKEKTDDFYRLAALRAAEGFSAKAPGKTKDQRYYASHKEQCKAKAKAYRAANKEKERERQRKWRKAHPEKCREIQRRWLRKHRDKWNAYMREWRRKKKEADKLQGVADVEN